MTSEFAKHVLDFLAQKAGEAYVWYNYYDVPGVEDKYCYDFYVKNNEDHILSLYFNDNGTFKSIMLSKQPKLHIKPYVWLLNTMLKYSQQNKEIIYYNRQSDANVFLKPKTTLEQILIEMDLTS